MGVNALDIGREKFWLQDLYPARRQETGLRRKDDGGGLKHLDVIGSSGPISDLGPRGAV